MLAQFRKNSLRRKSSSKLNSDMPGNLFIRISQAKNMFGLGNIQEDLKPVPRQSVTEKEQQKKITSIGGWF